ncbi:RHS repeat domain-containing protein [Pseudomonas yamanorum]|uniref:RHS repeat domain-containing protein n=1 Tax=Pseudomonas yamanorum TaxID=515393 RepID=UPI003B9F69E1
MDVYSNAFNFSSHLSGSVDMRTGQFGCRIQLASLSPVAPLETSREIALSFSMMSTLSSIHYGTGWRLSNTEFDVATSKLTLLTGEQYQAQSLPPVGYWLVINDSKLKDMVVKRESASTLHVIYKDGTVEVLGRPVSSGPYKIIAIQFESGERLSFQYNALGALNKVLDTNNKDLLVLTYSNGKLETADAAVDGGRYARTKFGYSNERLTSVTIPYDREHTPGTPAYTFNYRAPFGNGLTAIERMTSPMGATDLITYEEIGHQYANGQHIPRVTVWKQTPAANQPEMVKTYKYSPGANFTGYPYTGGFTAGVDNLYRVLGDYDYWAEESCTGNSGPVLSSTRNTYNKFHLATKQEVLREGTRVTRSLTYNIIAGKTFSEQPANLQLPRQITKRYELVAGGAFREEVQVIQTDDYGNELSRTEASGVCTEYSYYPIVGESGKCPADPHNLFQRYVKQERLVPVGSAPAARLTEYTHIRLPQTGSTYFVLQESTKQTGVFEIRQTYYDTPVELAGRLKTSTSTVDGQELVSDFSYTVSGDTLVETRRLNGGEGQWLEAVRTLSLANRRLLSMTRDGGSTLALAYDVSGRLTSETVSPGTPQQAVRSYAYHFSTPTKRAHLITTDAQGNKAITYFDGVGRQVAEAQLLGSNQEQERNTATWVYDALGQTVEEVHFDYVGNTIISAKSTYAFSRWGNVSRIIRPDGSVTINEYDPLLNLTEEGIVGGERLMTYFNAQNLPIKVERLDGNNNKVEIESRTYDSLGRCLTAVDINKTSTELTYDAFDRVVTTLQKPVDGTPERLRKTDYAAGTSGELVSGFTVDDKLLGTRRYDSLGRMSNQARGTGQVTSWEYEAGWLEPIAMVSTRGVRQSLTYNKELDVPTRIEMTGQPLSTYQHDPVAGALKRSESNGLIHEFFLDANGHPEKEVQTANGTSLSTQYGFSPGGLLLNQTSFDGQYSEFEYDAFGRFSKMTSGPMVVEQTYDALGRPQNLTTSFDSTEVITKVSYDSLGRESERRFEQNGALLNVMTSTYHVNSMLASRVLKDAGSRELINERYTYDAFLRLKTYRCEGLEHPRDHLGRGIVAQDFTFDSLNNITSVVTVFADGTADTSERFFTGSDPTQLTRLTHTLPAQDITLAYDAAGNLQASPGGQAYTFNGFEQLTEVHADALKYSYQYDAESRQVLASRANEPPVMLAYAGEHLDVLAEGDKKIRYVYGVDEVVMRTGGADWPQLHMNDASGSVRGTLTPGQAPLWRHYTPFGDTKLPLDDGKVRSMADLQLPAFNGQRLDAAVNLYFLGNGQRAYDPDLMVFLQPDPLSPFDEGGINSYAYCAGNPINLVDPSGLWPSWLKWALTGTALALSVVTFGFGVVGVAAAVGAYAAKSVALGLAATVATAGAAASPAAMVGAAGGVATATAFATSAAAAAAFTAGLTIASKTAITTGAGLGIVSGTLGTSALGIAAVDKARGWDRSNVISQLGVASLVFSIASSAVSVFGAYTSAHMAYRSTATFTGVGKLTDTRIGSALYAARQRMLGLSYKFTDKTGVTPFSQAFGGTRAVLRFTNLGRSIENRSKSSAAPSPGTGGGGGSAQPQSQATISRFIDTPTSSSGYYQSFRDEASRIRQPIMGELYRG